MAYDKTQWQDRTVEKPRTFSIQENPDGTITLIPMPGTVITEGTPVNAANMNKIETGLSDAHAQMADLALDLNAHKENSVAHGTATKAEAQAGTSHASYMTPLRTKEAIQALQAVTSVAGKTGVVTVTKSDVNLGSVENYGIATQAEAEAGVSNVKYMTPLRVFQAINKSNIKTYGTITLTDSITINSEITKNIPIGSGKQNATVAIRNYTSKGRGALIFCGTDKTKTYAVGLHNPVSVISRQFSATIMEKGGFGSGIPGGVDDVYLVDMYISGSNLVIVFKNTSTEWIRNLDCQLAWEVW